jgi:hypothetical protein
MRTRATLFLLPSLLLALVPASYAAERRTVNVADDAALRRALRDTTSGTRIVIASGHYPPAVYVWFAEDQPAHSRPDLPTPERGGVYGVDPKVVPSDDGVPSAPAAEQAQAFGADALPASEAKP